MDLDELRALLAVAETGSFAAAAKSLSFARATLRRRVDELEARMGVPLLRRDGATWRPTQAGQLLVTRAPKLLEEAQGLVEAVRSGDRDPQEIHLVLLPGPPPELLNLGLELFLPLRRRVCFRSTFVEDPTQLPDDATFGVDVAEHPPVGPFRVYTAATMPVGLWATPEIAARVTSVEALHDHPIAVWRNREGPLDELRLDDGRREPLRPFIQTCDVALLRGFAERGSAIAYGPRPPSLKSDRVARVLPDQVGHTVSMHLLVPSRSTSMSAIVERLVRFLGIAHAPT